MPEAVASEGGQIASGLWVVGLAVLVLLVGSLVSTTMFAIRLHRVRRDQAETRRLVEMGEALGELGFWQFDPLTRSHEWSPGLYQLFGLELGEPLQPGDVECMLVDGGRHLMGRIEDHATDTESYSFPLDIRRVDGAVRHFRINACNRFSPLGQRERVCAVVRDASDEVASARRLDRERAMAVEQAAIAEELAHTDALTGLANRRRAMATIDRAVLDSAKSCEPLGLLAFDIDHFKSVNDNHGHQAGDAVLVRIAELARVQTRSCDLVARMGGEEFLWLMPGADSAALETAAERLRRTIEFGSAVDGVPPVTVSIGYAQCEPGDSALKLYARADAALYDAKEAGRNRIRMAA